MIIMDDSTRLSAVLERPSAGPCPLVIHLHGFSSNKDKLHNIRACEAMREAGFATLRVDLYGHGGSDGLFREHTLYRWISNTLAVIDEARKLDFVTDIYLAGHSQGGLTAALAAAMEPDHVSGLILRAPAFMIPRAAREGNMLGYSFNPAQVPDEVTIHDGLVLSGRYIRVAQTIRAEEAVAGFRGPVLLIHGDADDTVPLQDSIDASALYPDCTLRIMRGETHHFDRFPEEMKTIIREWLTAVDPQKNGKGK